MTLFVRQIVRAAADKPGWKTCEQEAQLLLKRRISTTPPNAWTCKECRIRQVYTTGTRTQGSTDRGWIKRRQLTNCAIRRDEGSRRHVPSNTRPTNPTRQAPSEVETPASTSTSLPSHTENQRWQASKRMSNLMDELLARASIAGQHINVYTGTDYTGIEALRGEILKQEQKVKTDHSAAELAKQAHHDAFSEQTSAQREIVALLERKSSWTPADLERYMSLVRSEHVNDQAVQVAKDNLAAAERDLEDGRSLLERLERKKYHEEQIWSDTIRRNSTWVTFGLMGLNILLLLAQIAIFEPNRRKKIVRDVKLALDEKTLATPMVDGQSPDARPPSTQEQVLEKLQKDGVSVTDDEFLGLLETLSESQQNALFTAAAKLGPGTDRLRPLVGSADQVDSEMLPGLDSKTPGRGLGRGGEHISIDPTAANERWPTTFQAYSARFRDLFSQRLIQMRKVDVTTTVLEGVATGAAVVGLLAVLLRT